MLEHAMTLRCAASACLAFSGVRRAPEIAGLRASDVEVDGAGSAAELKARQQKKDLFGAGQMAHVIALPSSQGVARPC